MNEKLLTLKEISRRLNVPESSIRYYRDRFEEYIPSRGEGRKRRYKQEAFDIFRAIVQGYKKDLNAEEIKNHLERHPRGGPFQDENGSPRGSSAFSTLDASGKSPQDILQSQAQTLSSIAELLVHKNRLEEEVYQLREEQQKIKKGLLIVWNKYKQEAKGATQTDSKPSAYQDIENKLYDIQSALESLQTRQNELEQKQAQEMQALRQQVEKCQLWTKRFMLCSQSDTQEEGSS